MGRSHPPASSPRGANPPHKRAAESVGPPAAQAPESPTEPAAPHLATGQTTIYHTMVEQHHFIEQLISRSLQAVEVMTTERTAPRRLLLRLRKTLRAHIGLEDGILFREFESQSGLLADGPTATLRREHQVLLTRIDELLAELATAPAPVLRGHLAAFAALYTDHCRREDVMYGICERLLPPDLYAKAQYMLSRRRRSTSQRSE